MSRIEQVWKKIMTDMNQVEFLQPQEYSPYMEMSELEVTKKNDEKWQIYYNGMYRFEEVFSSLFVSTEVTEEEKAWLYDVFVHYLLQIELRNGFSQKEYQIRQIVHKIHLGNYGMKSKKLFAKLDMNTKYIIAEGIYRQERLGASVELFGEICIKVLGSSVLYKNTIDIKSLILCMSKERIKDELTEAKITLLEQMFLPLDYELSIFEEGTLGVIGEDVTMMPEHMVLF